MGTKTVSGVSLSEAVMYMWQDVQPPFTWSAFSCLNVATRLTAQCASTSESVMFLTEGFDVSPPPSPAPPIIFPSCCAFRSLWQPAQSSERGASPPSCQWQRKHESCPRGEVLNIPRLSQNSSRPSAFDFNSAGGRVTY